MLSAETVEWLTDPAQPAARYRCLTEIEGLSPRSADARKARESIPKKGWAARILGAQRRRGYWRRRKALYRPKYVATNWMLLVLADLGLTVQHPPVRRAVDLMLEDYGWSDGPFFRRGGEPHFCFVGNTAKMMILLGLEDDRHVRSSLDWLADTQLDDGGWDCFGRPRGTLDCWEALAAYAAMGRRRWTRKWQSAVDRGAEFYLERGLLREGRRRYLPWERLHYPVHYYYDVLVGLETLVRLGYGDDKRLKPARELIRRKMRPDGRWALDAIHPDLSVGANYGRERPTYKLAMERVQVPEQVDHRPGARRDGRRVERRRRENGAARNKMPPLA